MPNSDTPRPVATPELASRELIATDLRLLIAQIETSMRRIAAAMDQEHCDDFEGSADVVLLDDVTPRLPARARLSAPAGRASATPCNACRNPATRRTTAFDRLAPLQLQGAMRSG
jgi:hypothetical protein